jgi:hypothetical protein
MAEEQMEQRRPLNGAAAAAAAAAEAGSRSRSRSRRNSQEWLLGSAEIETTFRFYSLPFEVLKHPY